MKLIVGLGNPGVKFKNNRHNVGFMVLDIFAIEMGLSWRYNKDLMCYLSKTRDYVLVKPNTYVNESGQSVKAVCEYFDIDSSNVLVVHDEVDLEFGKIRLSFNSSSAGHHGVESINKGLATEDFARLRVGVGRPQKGDVTQYVLSDFSQEQKSALPEVVAKCEEAIKSYLNDGITATMNRFN